MLPTNFEFQSSPLRSSASGIANKALQDLLEPCAGIRSLLVRPPVPRSIEKMLPDGSSPWPISAALGRFLYRCVRHLRARNVLELGAGASSLVLARAVASIGGGRLTSVEQLPTWCAEYWSRVERIANVDSEMIVAQPEFSVSRYGIGHGYRTAGPLVARRRSYDLVLVDAPQAFYGRDGALPLIHRSLAEGAWIVLDDAARAGEQLTLLRWLRTYRGLRLILLEESYGGKGLAVLRYTGDDSKRIDPWTVWSSIHTSLELRSIRRKLQRAARSVPMG